jgi:hypothetical protein
MSGVRRGQIGRAVREVPELPETVRRLGPEALSQAASASAGGAIEVTEISIKLLERQGLRGGPCKVSYQYTIRRRKMGPNSERPTCPFMVRRHVMIPGEPIATDLVADAARSIGHARSLIPEGFRQVLGEDPTDDPNVVEVWA